MTLMNCMNEMWCCHPLERFSILLFSLRFSALFALFRPSFAFSPVRPRQERREEMRREPWPAYSFTPPPLKCDRGSNTTRLVYNLPPHTSLLLTTQNVRFQVLPPSQSSPHSPRCKSARRWLSRSESELTSYCFRRRRQRQCACDE